MDADAMLARRDRVFGPNAPMLYDQPLHLVRGEGVWMFAADGTRYLDCYNNVPHVGHCHPRVVAAVNEQTATLTTHSRYLHDTVVDYADQLVDLFDETLATLLLTCTGSEANDVALRLAELATGNRGLLVSDRNYHGNTSTVMRLSMARHQPADMTHVRTFSAPDTYRWRPGDDADGDVAAAVLADVDRAIESLDREGLGVGASCCARSSPTRASPRCRTGWWPPSSAGSERPAAWSSPMRCSRASVGLARCGVTS